MKIQTSVEELRKHKIFVGTPMYGAQCAGTYTKASVDLATMCAANQIGIQFYYLFNESLIQRARNYIADEFLRSDCTHLLFIDADIGFNPRDVLGLLAVQISDPEKYNIVTGLYPKKTIAWEKVQKAAAAGKGDENPFDLEHYTADYVFNPVNKVSSFNISEPLEIGEGGTGFMLIPRKTFERFAAAYPELSYKPDHLGTEDFDGSKEIMAYFDCTIDPESKRYLSEDYFFCWNVRKAGMKVHMCPWLQLQHIGTYTFRGSMSALAGLDMSPITRKEPKYKKYKSKLGTRA